MEMKPFSQIGEGFENNSRDAWEAQIYKELKDGNPTLLNANITDEITIPGWLDNTVVTTILEADLADHAAWADHPNAWKIAEDITESDAVTANTHALEALQSGVSVLRFKYDDNLNIRLKNIHPEMVELVFDKPNPAIGRFEKLELLADSSGKNLSEFSGLAATDAITEGVLNGGFSTPIEDWISECGTMLSKIVGIQTKHMLHEIDGLPWRMAGGNHIDILSHMLAHGAELLHLHQQKGHSLNAVVTRIYFRYPVGTDFLRDIAAIRALRVMWKAILKEYGIDIETIRVDAAMPSTELSAVDVNTNMLRYTSAAMAAVMAGCHTLYAAPFNFGETAQARRIARNVSHLLDSESHLSRVNDPLRGAYSVEALTERMATTAWAHFNHTETNGGLISCIQNGTVQDVFSERLNKREEKLKSKQEVKVGVNKYVSDISGVNSGIYKFENRGQFAPLKIAGIDQLCAV